MIKYLTKFLFLHKIRQKFRLSKLVLDVDFVTVPQKYCFESVCEYVSQAFGFNYNGEYLIIIIVIMYLIFYFYTKFNSGP